MNKSLQLSLGLEIIGQPPAEFAGVDSPELIDWSYASLGAGHRVCPACGNDKPAIDYKRRDLGYDFFHTHCSRCCDEYRSRHYGELPGEQDSIRQFLQSKGVASPDLVTLAYFFDPAQRADLRKDLGDDCPDCPISASRDPSVLKAGCYAWIEAAEKEYPIEVMYVGKAINLRNRLSKHWLDNTPFLEQWFDEYWEECRTFLPNIAIWFSQSRAALESDLIEKLSPRYNQRRE